MTTNYVFKAFYTALGVGVAPSSAPTIKVVDSDNNVLVNDLAATALANLTGGYVYEYSGADGLQLIGRFTTSDETVDAREIACIPDLLPMTATDVRSAVGLAAANLDTQLDALPTAAEVRAEMDANSTKLATIATDTTTDIPALIAAIETTATVAISATTAATVADGELAIRKYYTFRQAITSTSTDDLTAATKIWWAIKRDKDDTDAEGAILCEEAAGLTIVNGAAYGTAAHGSLTVSGSSGAWTITLYLDEAVTSLLSDSAYYYDVKYLLSGDTKLYSTGKVGLTTGIVQTNS